MVDGGAGNAVRLRELAERAGSLEILDPDAVAQFGLALEECASAPSAGWLEGPLCACLEAAQALYTGASPDPEALRSGAETALWCAAALAAAEDALASTTADLRCLLGDTRPDTPEPLSEQRPPEPAGDPVTPSPDSVELDPDLLREFLVESYENLEQLDRDMVALEQAPGDRSLLASIFRTIHTIKGTCGFLGLQKLEKLAHAGENVLGRLRDGELALEHAMMDVLLETVDRVRELLRSVETTRSEGAGDYTELCARLARLAAGEPVEAAAPAARDRTAPDPAAASEAPIRGRIGHLLVSRGLVSPADLERALRLQKSGDARRVGEILLSLGSIRPEQLDEALHSWAASTSAPGVTESSIRVDVSLLDRLMNLVGELVLARNQILQATSQNRDTRLTAGAQQVNLVTSEIQEALLKTRMQPIRNAWSRVPRLVRDVSGECGKQVRVEMVGEGTELDRTLLEAIRDPLTHLIRNAVDHGIEDPATREAAGKPAEGLLRLEAYHESGQVNLVIRDDGRGIDAARVRARALERGLLSPEQAARMSEDEVLRLIFAPGFSTAEQVTRLSGRGVGMDVVKTNIEGIGGTVDLRSQPGAGTTLHIRVPLTLAITRALMVSSAGSTYALPQASVLEVVRLKGDEALRGIEQFHEAPVFRLRGRLIPLVDLGRYLGEAGCAPSPEATRVVTLVVLQAAGRLFGLVVDRIHGNEEIVVKPLQRYYNGLPMYAGATILGNGRVALILDVNGLAQSAGVTARPQASPAADAPASSRTGERRRTLLLVGTPGNGRAVIALDEVARLEKFRRDDVERLGRQEVVQYRGGIMPLVRLWEEPWGEAQAPARATFPVVVYPLDGRELGLVVHEVLDIVPESGGSAFRAGAIIRDRVTEVLELPDLLRSALDASLAA